MRERSPVTGFTAVLLLLASGGVLTIYLQVARPFAHATLASSALTAVLLAVALISIGRILLNEDRTASQTEVADLFCVAATAALFVGTTTSDGSQREIWVGAGLGALALAIAFYFVGREDRIAIRDAHERDEKDAEIVQTIVAEIDEKLEAQVDAISLLVSRPVPAPRMMPGLLVMMGLTCLSVTLARTRR